MFPRPSLFDSPLGAVAWTVIPALMLAGGCACVAVGPLPARLAGVALVTAVLGALAARFIPRWRDIRAVAYRCRQGVAVVPRDGVVPPSQALVEAALERAIAACGWRPAIYGWGLLLVGQYLRVRNFDAHGVADAGWLQVAAPPGQPESMTLGLITHECAHVLLDAAGVPVEQHHAVMATKGIL